MKKAFLYIGLTIIFSFLLSSIAYYVYQKALNHYHFQQQIQVREIVEGSDKYDILFIGSSRAKRHINPYLVDSMTGTKSYNAGMLGANIYEMKMVLNCFLKNHPAPEFLFIEIPNPAFDISKTPFYNPSIYFEHLDNEIVFEAMKPSQHVYLNRWLPFTRLAESSELLRSHALLGLTGKTFDPKLIYYRGFMSYNADTLRLPLHRAYPSQVSKIEPAAIAAFRDMIALCRQKQITPILLYTPVYKKNDEPMNPKFFITLEGLAKELSIQFWNYRMDEKFANDHTLFFDEVHMNREGSAIFSQHLAARIDQLLDSTSASRRRLINHEAGN